MARILQKGITFVICAIFTFMSLLQAKVYDIGEEPASCPAISELPPPFEGWEYLTCKADNWMWASLNAGTHDDLELACEDRDDQLEDHPTYGGKGLYYVINRQFLHFVHFPNSRYQLVTEALKKLTPKRTFWYFNVKSMLRESCDEPDCHSCFTVGWSEEKNDFKEPVETDCKEKHYALCFGVFNEGMD